VTWVPEISLCQLRANLAANGPQLYVGTDGCRLVWAGAQQALLVLGPPRSGKTSTLVIPNALAAPGPVIVTSTKPDVLRATLASRSEVGRCWLFDPSGTVEPPAGSSLVRWSPVQASLSWEEALVTARVMTASARPHGNLGESSHWTERAEALLAPLFHAAALASASHAFSGHSASGHADAGMRQVLAWVLRHDLQAPAALLAQEAGPGCVALDVLAGISITEERERSGILSTAAGVLSAYRSERALELAELPNFDPASFPSGRDTVYICAPARYQALMAPVVVAFLEQVRSATYKAAAGGTLRLPVTFLLDEVANVAPLPDLPAMVSEGGGQGLLSMACLQDLSQARGRWGRAAEGFFSLFGTKVLLPGIGDLETLEVVSRLAGQGEVVVRSVSGSAWWGPRPATTTTYSSRRQARLPVDQVHSLPPGSALVIGSARPPRLVALTRWHDYPPFRDAALAHVVTSAGGSGRELAPAPSARPPTPPPSPKAPPLGGPGSIVWRRVPRQRPLHPPPPRV
jgi:type IV secretory pathway TraG/TraD family ATPase VirD4